jgi:hypothetical protein
MKELRFHPQMRTMLFTTAQDSFNVFRPNLDPDDYSDEGNQSKAEESKTSGVPSINPSEYAVD